MKQRQRRHPPQRLLLFVSFFLLVTFVLLLLRVFVEKDVHDKSVEFVSLLALGLNCYSIRRNHCHVTLRWYLLLTLV